MAGNKATSDRLTSDRGTTNNLDKSPFPHRTLRESLKNILRRKSSYVASPSTMLAKGGTVFQKMLKIEPIAYKDRNGGVIQPMTIFKDGSKHQIIFVSYLAPYVVFYQSSDDTLRSEVDTEFTRRYLLGAYAGGVLSARLWGSAYQAFVWFSIALYPGGISTKVIRSGINLLSILSFYSKNRGELFNSITIIQHIVLDLRIIATHYPVLFTMMMALAFKDTIKGIEKEKRKKGGLFKLVLSNIDTGKMVYELMDFLGSLLKSRLFPSATPAPIKWLAKKGFWNLAIMLNKVWKVYKKIKLLQKGKAAITPKLADSQLLAAKFIAIFGQEGIHIAENEKGQLAKELRGDQRYLDRLQAIANNTKLLEKKITFLLKEANRQIFTPV